MHPIRLLLLIILFYLLYRLLIGGRQKNRQGNRREGAEPISHDVLVEDPVCHTYIPRGQATTLQEKGMTHYFCSESCKKKYLDKLRSNE